MDLSDLRKDLAGFALSGNIRGPGKGPAVPGLPTMSRQELHEQIPDINAETISILHEDEHAAFLIKDIFTNVKANRMTQLARFSHVGVNNCFLARRFTRMQGSKPDGIQKLRAVDDETGNGFNHTACQEESVRHDHVLINYYEKNQYRMLLLATVYSSLGQVFLVQLLCSPY